MVDLLPKFKEYSLGRIKGTVESDEDWDIMRNEYKQAYRSYKKSEKKSALISVESTTEADS